MFHRVPRGCGRSEPPSGTNARPVNAPRGSQTGCFTGCWKVNLPAARNRGRRPRGARGWAAALSGPHRRGRQRSKRHPGAASGRRAGHISVFVVVLRSQRRRGTRAAGPRVRGGGVPAPRKVAEHGARAPFQRALQTAKAVEVQLSSGAGRRRACKTTNVPGFYLMCFQSSMPVLSLVHMFLCALSMASCACAGPRVGVTWNGAHWSLIKTS